MSSRNRKSVAGGQGAFREASVRRFLVWAGEGLWGRPRRQATKGMDSRSAHHIVERPHAPAVYETYWSHLYMFPGKLFVARNRTQRPCIFLVLHADKMAGHNRVPLVSEQQKLLDR